ncbi:hypothetical protein DW729_18960 [Bacteroides uniformis]|uniref:Uncharacterized protein n=1 Tax=Bacteroides uniformis TaxID=820 RepID=A0A414JJZ6_BACUN|nr:hypothetical protein DW729_18960 [Bacteroides uniformis]
MKHAFFLGKFVNVPKVRTFAMCFHSIRFKVNKGWSTAVLLFLCPHLSYLPLFPYKKTYSLGETPFIFLKTRLK